MAKCVEMLRQTYPWVTEEALRGTSDNLKMLANFDRFAMFLLAGTREDGRVVGFRSGESARQLLNLTPKRYDTAYDRLLESGFVEKIGGSICQTNKGQLAYDPLMRMLLIEAAGVETIDELDRILKSDGAAWKLLRKIVEISDQFQSL
ncbi:MAG: hypothetical protein KGH98_02950 [Candidatus Micrarchaeota archaeon]|nr:hypothetical protein [Candidatus Micrarchaeota archaeon]